MKIVITALGLVVGVLAVQSVAKSEPAAAQKPKQSDRSAASKAKAVKQQGGVGTHG